MLSFTLRHQTQLCHLNWVARADDHTLLPTHHARAVSLARELVFARAVNERPDADPFALWMHTEPHQVAEQLLTGLDAIDVDRDLRGTGLTPTAGLSDVGAALEELLELAVRRLLADLS